jgi:hypothetical protein
VISGFGQHPSPVAAADGEVTAELGHSPARALNLD